MTPIDNLSGDPTSQPIRYPDATMSPLDGGQWKLVTSKGTSSLHASRDAAYDALMEIREKSCEGDEGCLMCSG